MFVHFVVPTFIAVVVGCMLTNMPVTESQSGEQVEDLLNYQDTNIKRSAGHKASMQKERLVHMEVTSVETLYSLKDFYTR